MKKLRFYIGLYLMELGMAIMPFEADASVRWKSLPKKESPQCNPKQ